MKIEKINDNQIRCVLSKTDLDDRNLNISELAYGSDKAKVLFSDMMEQASFEYGFEADNLPLMIEAIPLNADSIVLVITKVEDPEELDTRFSKFSSEIHSEENDLSSLSDDEHEDSLTDFDNKVLNSLETYSDSDLPFASDETVVPAEKDSTVVEPLAKPLYRILTFDNLDALITVSKIITNKLNIVTSLYKSNNSLLYYLVILQETQTPLDFYKSLDILSEYSTNQQIAQCSYSYINEHARKMIDSNVFEYLSQL